MSGSRRTLILEGAGRLFAGQGVAGTTVRQIGESIGILSGSLYYYFPSKESIAAEIIRCFLDELVAEYAEIQSGEEASREQLQHLVETSFRVAALHPFATEIYQNEASNLGMLPGAAELLATRDMAQATWHSIIARGIDRGEFRADVDAEEFQRMLSELVWLKVRWHRPALAERHLDMADQLIAIFLDGFATDPHRTVRPTEPEPIEHPLFQQTGRVG